MSESDSQFVSLLTSYQSRLYAYVLSLVGDAHLAADVMQETNVVLWRKSGEFVPGTDFAAWAFHVAYLQVMAGRQRQSRNRLLFSDELLHQLAEESAACSVDFDARLLALDQCLGQLRPEHQEVIRLKYAHGQALSEIAETAGVKANAVGQLLHRLRLKLLECIRTRLQEARA